MNLCRTPIHASITILAIALLWGPPLTWGDEKSTSIDDKTVKQWSAPYRGWHYYPDHVIASKPGIEGYAKVHMTDVPTVFQLPGDDTWYMTFIGFDGMGYQSFIAESDDLVHWRNMRLAMGFGKKGEFDFGGVVLGSLKQLTKQDYIYYVWQNRSQSRAETRSHLTYDRFHGGNPAGTHHQDP